MKPVLTFVRAAPTAGGKIDTAIFPVFENESLQEKARAFDKAHGGLIAHALGNNVKFKAKAGQTLEIGLGPGASLKRVILLGLGARAQSSLPGAETAGAHLYKALEKAASINAVFHAEPFNADAFETGEFYAYLAFGLKLRAYKFRKYKTPTESEGPCLNTLTIVGVNAKHYKALEAVAEGVYFARDAVNEPPNHLYPETFARRIYDTLTPLGVEVEILDEKRMAKLRMGAALAVGQGSDRPPRMVIMRLNGGKAPAAKAGKKRAAPVAFVGKGITFDTGGISLKPGQGMEEMKMDMGGAAAVAGLMLALARSGSRAHVVGIAAIAENMPSGNAYRPSDILKSYSGKTIEVLNTDAEGRLVLADALSYIQKAYKPRAIIDLATLTGAIVVALGGEYAGVFANDEALWSQIEKAGAGTGEKIWRMPLDKAWKKEMEGDITDLRNLGKGKYAGAGTAAGFLEHFIEKGTPWAHMDIAGVAWSFAEHATVMPRSATGFGVRLLHRFVRENYE